MKSRPRTVAVRLQSKENKTIPGWPTGSWREEHHVPTEVPFYCNREVLLVIKY